jgi:hypothetical protein
VADAPLAQPLDKVFWLGEITNVAKSPDLGRVGLDGRRIAVGTDENREPCIPQTDAEASGATEEIDCGWGVNRLQPCPNGLIIAWIGWFRLSRQTNRQTARMFQARHLVQGWDFTDRDHFCGR